MKILITGGHLTPALAVIDELQKQSKNNKIEIIFVGRKYSLDSEKTLSLEYRIICDRGIRFIPLQAGRLTRFFSLKSLRSLIRIPWGFINSLRIILTERPNIVFSFGGYIALPIVLWAWVLRIPSFTHEQTISPGLANKIIAFFTKKNFIAFKESMEFFSTKKTYLVGNPVRDGVLKIDRKLFKLKPDKPILYVTGGSLGSHSINLHIAKILPQLVKDFIVIHQTGSTKEFNNLEMMSKVAGNLSAEFKKNYIFREHFFENELGYIYSISDIVISRAGANTFFELVVWKKPTIFVPLPWSSNQEQAKHALLFKEAGCGEIFNQNLASHDLLLLINRVKNNLNSYRRNFNKLHHLYKHNASQFIVSTILSET